VEDAFPEGEPSFMDPLARKTRGKKKKKISPKGRESFVRGEGGKGICRSREKKKGKGKGLVSCQKKKGGGVPRREGLTKRREGPALVRVTGAWRGGLSPLKGKIRDIKKKNFDLPRHGETTPGQRREGIGGSTTRSKGEKNFILDLRQVKDTRELPSRKKGKEGSDRTFEKTVEGKPWGNGER